MKLNFDVAKALPWIALISLGQCTSCLFCVTSLSEASKPKTIYVRDTVFIRDTVWQSKALSKKAYSPEKMKFETLKTTEPSNSFAPKAYSAPKIRSKKTSSKSEYITGPRGGCYYINGNGKKVYVDHSYCQ